MNPNPAARFLLNLSNAIFPPQIERLGTPINRRSLAPQTVRLITLATAPEKFAQNVQEVRRREALAHGLEMSFTTINRREISKFQAFCNRMREQGNLQ